MKVKSFYLSAFLSVLAASAMAVPYRTAYLDGRPAEYDPTELRAWYTGGGGVFGAGTYITNLYVTWDATYLYVMLQGAEVNDKLVVLLDVDPGQGTGAAATTNWTGVTPDYIQYNDISWQRSTNDGATPFGLDFQVASEGFYNNIVGILYDGIEVPSINNTTSLFDSGNGASPLGTPVDMVVQSDGTDCGLKGIEARIPWSTLYPASGRFGTVLGGDTVPVGATVRLLAMIHNNDPVIGYSSNDAIPEQTSTNASWVAGLLTSDNYVDVIVDNDNDGVPDTSGIDANAPHIRYASGVQSQLQLFVQFDEPLRHDTVTNVANWRVGGDTPGSIAQLLTNAVLLDLTNALPAAGSLVLVSATNAQDEVGNQRLTEYCLFPAASGLTNALTVRFVLETASGLGLRPGASNFCINGGNYPLEFGYPPVTSSPLSVLAGTLHYRDVIFPPGTPQVLNYKYSGVFTASGGTNVYEAIRLSDYANAARRLTLPLDQTSLVLTDYLGAAAAPFLNPGTNTSHAALYSDTSRGDAGVREPVTIKLQLDLRMRNRSNLSRVLVQGTDPLRGFNMDGTLPAGIADYAGGGGVGWTVGGLTLFDDGSHGDTNANDGIYARDWILTPSGTDPSASYEPDFPNSLVGGGLAQVPYNGFGWADGRSPRSFGYKFYVLRSDNSTLESPAANIEVYLEATNTLTNIVFSPFVWDNEGLPPPPPSNSPTLVAVTLLNTGTQARVVFTNVTTESAHGLWVSTNLLTPWLDYGHRASGAGGSWTTLVNNLTGHEVYLPFADLAPPFQGVRISPFPVDAGGGTMRVYYVQHSRGLAGDRNVHIAGTFNGWTAQPMAFLGNGVWYYDALITPEAATKIEFKPRNLSGSQWEGMGGGNDNYLAYKGFGRASWTPLTPTNEELLTITYDAAGGLLANATSVNAWVGFEEQWLDSSARKMTNLGGTVWTLAFPVPTNRSLSVNFVFNGQTNGSPTVHWDNEVVGRLNRAFIAPSPYP